MTGLRVDAIACPSWSSPPASRARWNEDYSGDNSQVLVPPTGLPAISVPMTLTEPGPPAGLQLVGRYMGEADLLALAAAYERTTRRANGVTTNDRWRSAWPRGPELERLGCNPGGGEGGIRTHDRVAPIPHFECGAFDHLSLIHI